MAAEPISAQNLDAKNASAEPKKKLKKKRSIRVSRASNLRANSRRFKSRLSWESFDLGSDDDDSNDYGSSLHQSSSVASSDSLPNHIKSSASFVPSRGSHQGGSECDDGNSVVSSSSGSTEWIVQPSAVSVSDDGSVVQNSYSTEVSDASLDHPKAQKFSDGRKASNMRNAKVLIKKVSFKPKRATCKCGHMNEESNLEKATCSSIIKDARFPDRVELQPGEAESERISFAKVCRYHHCSLNGHHSHDPPLVKKFSFLRRKSGKPQMNAKSNNIASRPRTKSSVDMKDLKKPDITPSVGSSADEDTLKKNQKSKDSKEANKNSKGPHDLSAEGSYDNEKEGQTSFDQHPNLNRKARENIPDDIARKSSSEEVDEARMDHNVRFSTLVSEAPRLNVNEKESKYNQKLDENLTESTLGGEKETASSLKLQKPQFNGGKSMSFWNLIHKQMVSSLTEEDATIARKRIQGAEEEKQVKETEEDISNQSFVSYPSESDVGINHMEGGNQETEVQKLFAIKMVREAIEKILLPELQDQSSETQSITSESTEDHQLPKDNHQEDPAEDKYNFDTKSSERISNDSIGDTAKNTSETKRVKSEKKSPSNWSNLKKWILLQRFVKAMEKVRKFKPRQPHHLPLESDPDAEKVDLRRQTVSERKRSEEWMLDYAIRQVVSELAPTQKRKVALLVKAFETIVPTQEDTQVSWPHLKGERHESISVTSKDDLVEDMKPQPFENVPVDEESKQEVDGQDLSSVSTENLVTDSEPFPDVEKRDVSPHAIKSTVREMDLKVTVTVKIQPEAVNNVPEDTISVSKLLHNMDIKLENAPFDPKDEVVVYNQERPTKSEIPLESVLKGNEKAQIQLDKENYMIMWHMIYQHVAANIASKVGNHFLGGGDKEFEDFNISPSAQITGCERDSTERSTDAAAEVSDQESDFSRSDAVKLIQEAVDEILLPEIPDDTSDTQSVTSEATLDQDPYEIERGEVVNESIANTSVLNEEYVKEIERSSSVVSVEETKPTPPKLKSWRKLKKLMLLKRSIKAMEKARKLTFVPRQNLPIPSEAEPEKVDLRSQMVNERKKAEQWMLDYAVQNIVTELTPARKRRVAMLVEAFEAVVPLPEI